MTDPFDIRRIAHPRPAASKANSEVREILLDTVRQMDLEPFGGENYAWPYFGKGVHALVNLLGVLPGADPSLSPMVLGAHYDSVPDTPGADDNAAAIWVVLNAVHDLKRGALRRSVIVALFDAEEPPYFLGPLMGSTVFYQSQLKRPLHCTLIFDLVGHDVPIPGLEDLVFITGMESHRSFEPILNNTLPESGLRILPALNRYVGDLSDYHVFRTHGEPYLFFSCGHWQHYHMPTDTVDRLNTRKMGLLSAYVRKLLIGCDEEEFPRGSPEHDTTATDLKFMNGVLEQLLRRTGQYPLRSRGDIDATVHALKQRFGL